MENQTQKELSYGQKAVGVKFNPSGMTAVDSIKEKFAGIIDDLNTARDLSTNPEVKRQLSVAITEAQTSQMWAVKAMTWQY